MHGSPLESRKKEGLSRSHFLLAPAPVPIFVVPHSTGRYQLRKLDSLKDHGVIAGGYTNNHVVKFDKVDLDRFRDIHGGIVKEMQQVTRGLERRQGLLPLCRRHK